MRGRQVRVVIALITVAAAGAVLAPAATAKTKVTEKRIYAKNPNGQVFSASGLQLRANCNDASELDLSARFARAGGEFRIGAWAGSDIGGFQHSSAEPITAGEEVDFDQVLDADLSPDIRHAAATYQVMMFPQAGGVVSVRFVAIPEGVAHDGDARCLVAGVGRVAKPGVRKAKPSPFKTFRFAVANDSPAGPVKVFDRGGLEIRATCDGPDGFLRLRFRSEHENAMLALGANEAVSNAAVSDNATFLFSDLIAGGDAIVPTDDDNDMGQIVYTRLGGPVITIDYSAEEFDAFGLDCFFSGLARIASTSKQGKAFFAATGAKRPGATFRGAGLSLLPSCSPGGSLGAALRSSTDEATVMGNLYREADLTESPLDPNFDDGINDQIELDEFSGFDSVQGSLATLIYASKGGNVATVDLFGLEATSFGGTRACSLAATASALPR
jgi:hypothetical protein